MRVVTAEFVIGAVRPEQFPRDGRPEFAFAGRSNVGKSTLLNVLLNRRGLAKTSKKPGKTREINFFNINDKIYFVDLPGYGYARVPVGLKAEWGKTITDYLGGRKSLRLVLHLVDARHDPTTDDVELLDLLERAEVPALVVATKFDKLKASARGAALRRIRDGLHLDERALIVPFSSITKEGLRELWNVVDECFRAH